MNNRDNNRMAKLYWKGQAPYSEKTYEDVCSIQEPDLLKDGDAGRCLVYDPEIHEQIRAVHEDMRKLSLKANAISAENENNQETAIYTHEMLEQLMEMSRTLHHISAAVHKAEGGVLTYGDNKTPSD